MGERSLDPAEELRTGLQDLARLAERGDAGDAAEDARSTAARLSDARGRLLAAVVGEFKRGKSTLINALIGRPLLPTGVVPVTSLVTAVSWGPRPAASIEFQDGRREAIRPEDLGRFVTEQGNPGNRLSVRSAELEVPWPPLEDGLVLVDTPGVGSVHERNTLETLRFLPRADAVIFVTSSEPPISLTERAFLEAARPYAARLIVVLTKVDRLDPRERTAAGAFVAEVLAETLGAEPTIVEVDGKTALRARLEGDHPSLAASGIHALEDALDALLVRDKRAVLIAAASARAGRVLDDLRNATLAERAALWMSLADLEERLAAIEAIVERARESRGLAAAVMRERFSSLLRSMEGDLGELRREGERRLRALAADRLERAADPRRDLEEILEELKGALRADLGRWLSRQERDVEMRVSQIGARFDAEMHGATRDALAAVGDLLDLRLDTPTIRAELRGRRRFFPSFPESPTMVGSLLPDGRRFLPRRIAERRIRRELHAQVTSWLDAQSGRLRWDLVQRLEETRRAMERSVEERMGACLAAIERAVTRIRDERRSRSVDLRTRDEDLRERLDRLQEIARRVETVRERIPEVVA